MTQPAKFQVGDIVAYTLHPRQRTGIITGMSGRGASGTGEFAYYVTFPGRGDYTTLAEGVLRLVTRARL